MQGVIETVKDVVASAAAAATAGVVLEGFTGDREVATQTAALTLAVFATFDIVGRNVIGPVGTYLHSRLAGYSEHPYYQGALTVGSEALKVVSSLAVAVPGIVGIKMLVEPVEGDAGIATTSQTLVPLLGAILASKIVGERTGATADGKKYNAMRAEVLATVVGIEAMGYAYGNPAEVLPAGTAFAMAGVAKSVVRDSIDPALGATHAAATAAAGAAASAYHHVGAGLVAARDGVTNAAVGFYQTLVRAGAGAAVADDAGRPLMDGGDTAIEVRDAAGPAAPGGIN